MEKNTKIDMLLDRFEENVEQVRELTDEQIQSITSPVQSREELEEGLPSVLERMGEYKRNIEQSAANKKQWDESKKVWEGRSKMLMTVMDSLMTRLKISKNTIKANGVKLATSVRTSLEVNEEWLLKQYEAVTDELQARLPDYIKVTLEVDKNKLFAHVKSNPKMLMDNPDEIHTKESRSTTIK